MLIFPPIITLVLVMIIGMAAAMVVLSIRIRRIAASKLPTCGKCGYAVAGLNHTTCPECGSDLCEVGIYTPYQRAGSLPGILLVLWIIGMPIPLLVISVTLISIMPQVVTIRGTSTFNSPQSGAYSRAVVTTTGRRTTGWFGKSPTGPTPVDWSATFSHRSGQVTLTFDRKQGVRYAFGSASRTTNEFDARDFAEWWNLNVSTVDEDALAEEVFYIFAHASQEATQLGSAALPSSTPGAIGGGPVQAAGTGGGASSSPHPVAAAAVLITAAIVYIFGIVAVRRWIARLKRASVDQAGAERQVIAR